MPTTNSLSIDTLNNILNFKVDPITRTIFLLGEIDEDTFDWFLPVFSLLDQNSKKPITIKLTSSGGDTYIGFAIFDLIKTAKCKVTVEVLGYAHSIAALILQAADTRIMSENSKILIHDTIIVISENAHIKHKQMDAQAAELKSLCDAYYKNISERTGNTIEQIKKLGLEEKVMNSDEALKKGFVDKIIKGTK